jgi:hypothetical protein
VNKACYSLIDLRTMLFELVLASRQECLIASRNVAFQARETSMCILVMTIVFLLLPEHFVITSVLTSAANPFSIRTFEWRAAMTPDVSITGYDTMSIRSHISTYRRA